MLTHKFDRETQYSLVTEQVDPVEPDREKPFSHNWTGMVLRAFAAHQAHRDSESVQKAGSLLKSRLFEKDAYNSYQAARYWVRFEYPFWWNNLVAALDTLAWLEFSGEDEQIRLGLDWLIANQQEDGLWKLNYAKEVARDTPRNRAMRHWVGLAICRVFCRFEGMRSYPQ
jgi:hypothetical protein